MQPCTAKSKLMSILEGLVPEEILNKERSVGGITIIDGMTIVQAMGKPSFIRTGKDLADHFVGVGEQKSIGFDEAHVIFDRYDVPNSLKERT